MTYQDLLDKFGTVAQVAAQLGFHRRTVYYWRAGVPDRTQKHIEFQTGGALKAAKRKAKRA